MPEQLRERIERAIEEQVFPGCVVGIVRAASIETAAFGHATYEKEEVVSAISLYDLASVTKSIPLASLALKMLSDGEFTLQTHISDFLPHLHDHHDATVEDLLRYRVIGTRLSTLSDRSADEITKHIFESGLTLSAEERYTNLPAFLLGLIVEKVGGATLETLARDIFFGPLGMRATTFFPRTPLGAVPTERDETRGEVRALPHDESAYVFAKEGRAVGHAGLFSSAADICVFLQALLEGTYPYILEGGKGGLGWQRRERRFMGAMTSESAFGKTGFTGTSVLIDPEKKTALVILSNRTYPKRPVDGSAINALRSEIADIVFAL